jgi:serine protease inhibitor
MFSLFGGSGNQESTSHFFVLGQWYLLIQNRYSYLQNYIECAENLYNAKVERVDFTNDVQDTRFKINKWIENETHGK